MKPAAPAQRATETAPIVKLTGARALWALVPSLVLVAIALTARAGEHVAVRGSLVCAALGLAAWLALAWQRARAAGRVLEAEWMVRRPHYMQLCAQAGVYVYWAWHWDNVARQAPLIVAQLAFAYGFDMLLGWSRGRRWLLGFGQFPIVFSINLFLWMKDPWFYLQLAMVAGAFLGKDAIRWTVAGSRRHVFNPSALPLCVVSVLLLLAGRTDMSWGYDIAITQERPPHMYEALFLVGLIVQLQFPVVLVTLSSALALVALGAVYTQATGVYLFTNTAIPQAVLLGMTLLVTDPQTSPASRAGKVLFGAGYGALVFVFYLALEAVGPYGYFDKLLPVPILNLLVPSIERLGRRGDALLARVAARAMEWRFANYAHVGAWAGAFVLLLNGNAIGATHPGHDLEFWRRACAESRENACSRLLTMYDLACGRGIGDACHNLAAELDRFDTRTRDGRGALDLYEAACAAGFAQSCAYLGGRSRDAEPDGARAAGYDRRACDLGSPLGCHNLANAYERGRGVDRDLRAAAALYGKSCDGGLAQSCGSRAALAMSGVAGTIDKAGAARDFERACDAGDGAGCANLALMHERGDGVARDPRRAAALRERACRAPHGPVCPPP